MRLSSWQVCNVTDMRIVFRPSLRPQSWRPLTASSSARAPRCVGPAQPIDQWSRRAGGRRQDPDSLIAGIIPRAQGVTDTDWAQALAKRDQAMKERSWTLAVQATESRESWVRLLESRPREAVRLDDWLYEVSTVAAYRDRWHIEGQRPLGPVSDQENNEQMDQRKRALAARQRAKAISAAVQTPQIGAGGDKGLEVPRGVEL